MTLEDAPSWVREFLEVKAPWWLEDPMEILSVDEESRKARVQRGNFIYILDPQFNYIR